ncbi:hypothetical protein HDV01_002065 [Terramyces sp. JEL0728]|nr:hypothetical protein HDV01_002065 [Terramyces sp. JEL0728]
MQLALVTGANGSVGKGICQQLIETFSDIHLILACRSLKNAELTKQQLLDEFEIYPNQITCMQCDLSDTNSVFNLVQKVKDRFVVLDYLFLNAGILPVERIDLFEGVKTLITDPGYVARTGGDIIVQEVGQTTAQGLGQVFAANVFGHYILVKEFTDLLAASGAGKIIWCSSTTASETSFFSPEDFQCLEGQKPYESSKRLCELISIGINAELRERNVYSFITSPGNVLSGITRGAINEFMFLIALMIMRILFCSGINITGYNAATSALWIAKSEPERINPNVLYHSEINILAQRWVRSIELKYDKVDDVSTKKVLRKMNLLYGTYKQEWINKKHIVQ